jgi:hypothetical protein
MNDATRHTTRHATQPIKARASQKSFCPSERSDDVIPPWVWCQRRVVVRGAVERGVKALFLFAFCLLLYHPYYFSSINILFFARSPIVTVATPFLHYYFEMILSSSHRLFAMIFLELMVLCSFARVEGFVDSSSSSSMRRMDPHRTSRLLAEPQGKHSAEDFDLLFQEQTAEYGVDLAKEFQQEQQTRRFSGKNAKDGIRIVPPTLSSSSSSSSTSPPTTTSNSRADEGKSQSQNNKDSPGFFGGRSAITVSSTPTPARRRMGGLQKRGSTSASTGKERGPGGFDSPKRDSSSSSSDNNDDNLFWIMSASMTAYTSSQSPSAYYSTVLGLPLLLAVLLMGLVFVMAGDELSSSALILSSSSASAATSNPFPWDYHTMSSETTTTLSETTQSTIIVPHLHGL